MHTYLHTCIHISVGPKLANCGSCGVVVSGRMKRARFGALDDCIEERMGAQMGTTHSPRYPNEATTLKLSSASIVEHSALVSKQAFT